MSRFHFNIVTSAGKICDEEGTELPDLDAARAEAERQIDDDAPSASEVDSSEPWLST